MSSSGTTQSDLLWQDSEGTLHEWCTLLVFVRGSYLGETRFDPGSYPDLGYRRGGTLFICSTCGEIWARLVVTDSKNKQVWFEEICRVACERHWEFHGVAGSLLTGYRNWALLDLLPEAALKREFMLLDRRREDG